MVAGAAAVHRSIALVKALAQGGPAQRISALAVRTGIPEPTVARMLAALEEEGVARRAPVGAGWELGPEPVAWGAAALTPGFISHTRAALREIVARTGDAASLWLLREREAVCIAVETGTFPAEAGVVAGDRVRRREPSSPRATEWLPERIAADGVLRAAVEPLELTLRGAGLAFAVVVPSERMPPARVPRVRAALRAGADLVAAAT